MATARRCAHRARLRELGRRAAIVGLVVASGVAGVAAAFFPDGPLGGAQVEPATAERCFHSEAGSAPTFGEAWAEPRIRSEPLTLTCADGLTGPSCCPLLRP